MNVMRNESENSKKHPPKREDILRVFFRNIDLSRFSNINIDEVVSNLQSIISTWESNK